MKMQCKKSAWLRRGLLLGLLLTAGVLWQTEGRKENLSETLPSPAPVPTQQREERLKRETAYEQDVAALQSILSSGTADAATQEMAAQKLTALVGEHQSGIALEAALQDAGFADAAVIVQNGAVTVMIPQERLNEETGAQILALCVAHTETAAENVRVMGLE